MIGSLKHRLTFQTATHAGDSYGGRSATWADDFTIWGHITPLSAAQRYFAAKLEHVVTHKITIRKNTSVTISQRIVYESRIFQIHGVREIDENNRWMELSCQEGVGS